MYCTVDALGLPDHWLECNMTWSADDDKLIRSSCPGEEEAKSEDTIIVTILKTKTVIPMMRSLRTEKEIAIHVQEIHQLFHYVASSWMEKLGVITSASI